jgi:hypothetical protein
MALENIHIGPVDDEPDWRKKPDNSLDDDEEEDKTDPSVVAILGFDPAEEDMTDYNPNHEPAGSEKGGEFSSGGGSSIEGRILESTSESQKSQMVAAVRSIPAKDAESINHVKILGVKSLSAETDGKVYGSFNPDESTIKVSAKADFGGKKVQVISIEHALVHELGHAVDYTDRSSFPAWSLSTKMRKGMKAESEKMSAAEKNAASYFLENPREMFAEAYALTYAKTDAKAFGMSRDRARQIFAGTIAAIKARHAG